MTTDDDTSNADVLARLDALEAASDARRRELTALAEQVPAALSRRRLVAAAAQDLRGAPNKLDGLRRGLRKLARFGAPQS